MYCRKCGAEIPDDSVFCSKCGTPIEPLFDGASSAPETQVSGISTSQPKRKLPLKWILVSFAAVALIVCSVLFFSSRGKEVSILKDKEMLQSVSSSVLLIECYDIDGELYATGSGFVAFDDETIITNFHVIEDHPYSIAARSENGEVFEVDEIIGYHQEMDIAFLHVQGGTSLSPLPFSDIPVEKTDPVVAIGSPLGLMNTVSEGIVSGFAQIGDENVIQFTASISHGSSGGVLLNERGEVIGVTFGSFSSGQNLNLAVPIDYVKALNSKLSSADRISILDFFIAGNSVLPIDFIVSHYDLLVGTSVSIRGFVSSLFYYHYPQHPVLFLADSSSAVLSFDDKTWEEHKSATDTPGSLDEFLERYRCEELQEEISRAKQREVVVVRFNESRSITQFKPGSQVIVTGTLQEAGTYHFYQDIEKDSLVLETDTISFSS